MFFIMFRKTKTEAPSAENEREKLIGDRQQKLICANETRKQAAQALSEAGKEIGEAFYEEADRIIKEFDPELRTALKKSECRQTNVSRTYIIGRTPEMLEKFQEIGGEYGIISVSVKPQIDKIHVHFEIAE
jgi:hypothetical protein